jgi:FkbM family methyltransferase
LKKLLHRLLLTIGYRTLWLAKKVDPSGQARRERLGDERVALWYDDPRHVTRLYEFPLDEDALVFDVGGYEGSWALEILCRYGCRVEVFEPVPKFVDHLERRFAFSPRVIVHGFGLGARDDRLRLSIGAERSSFVYESRTGGETVEAEIRDLVGYLDERGVDHVDLLKLNIEGAEFELLERVLDAGRIGVFDHILVQFHDELPDASTRADAIARRLAETHERTWRFPFVWESWTRKA